MAYDEIRPPPTLRHAVVCYRSVTSATEPDRTGGAGARRIVPDGCFDLMFVVGGQSGVAALAVGPMTRAIVSPAPPASVDLFGVRFRPGAASRFFGPPLSELRDLVVPAASLLGGNVDALGERLAGTVGAPDRAAFVSAYLAARLDRWCADRAAAARIDLILSGAFAGSRVERIAADLRMSARQLDRIVLRDIGLRPKELIRLARFRRAFARLRHGPGSSLGRLAYEVGYADQAHFTREFKAFAGVPPSALAGGTGRTGVDDGSDLFKPAPD